MLKYTYDDKIKGDEVMREENKKNDFLKRIQIIATTLVATAGVTLGAGCSNANTESTKQSIPYTESIENLDQQLEEANRKILLDYSLFSNHERFSELTIQGKANATVQVDKDMDEWMENSGKFKHVSLLQDFSESLFF